MKKLECCTIRAKYVKGRKEKGKRKKKKRKLKYGKVFWLKKNSYNWKSLRHRRKRCWLNKRMEYLERWKNYKLMLMVAIPIIKQAFSYISNDNVFYICFTFAIHRNVSIPMTNFYFNSCQRVTMRNSENCGELHSVWHT